MWLSAALLNAKNGCITLLDACVGHVFHGLFDVIQALSLSRSVARTGLAKDTQDSSMKV